MKQMLVKHVAERYTEVPVDEFSQHLQALGLAASAAEEEEEHGDGGGEGGDADAGVVQRLRQQGVDEGGLPGQGLWQDGATLVEDELERIVVRGWGGTWWEWHACPPFHHASMLRCTSTPLPHSHVHTPNPPHCPLARLASPPPLSPHAALALCALPLPGWTVLWGH